MTQTTTGIINLRLILFMSRGQDTVKSEGIAAAAAATVYFVSHNHHSRSSASDTSWVPLPQNKHEKDHCV